MNDIKLPKYATFNDNKLKVKYIDFENEAVGLVINDTLTLRCYFEDVEFDTSDFTFRELCRFLKRLNHIEIN